MKHNSITRVNLNQTSNEGCCAVVGQEMGRFCEGGPENDADDKWVSFAVSGP